MHTKKELQPTSVKEVEAAYAIDPNESVKLLKQMRVLIFATILACYGMLDRQSSVANVTRERVAFQNILSENLRRNQPADLLRSNF